MKDSLDEQILMFQSNIKGSINFLFEYEGRNWRNSSFNLARRSAKESTVIADLLSRTILMFGSLK